MVVEAIKMMKRGDIKDELVLLIESDNKTFPENWVSKQSYVVFILTTAKKIFF